MLEQINAAVFVFASMGARGPAVLEIRRSEFEQLRAEMCELRGSFDATAGGVRIADAVALDFESPIGVLTVQSRPDEILGVPRFVLIEKQTGRQHAIMDVQPPTGLNPAQPSAPPAQSDVLELAPVRPRGQLPN